MTIALILIFLIGCTYIITLLFPEKNADPFHWENKSMDRIKSLKKLRSEISKHSNISKELIYSNKQIDQFLKAGLKTNKELIKFGVHREIVKKYGKFILEVINIKTAA